MPMASQQPSYGGSFPSHGREDATCSDSPLSRGVCCTPDQHLLFAQQSQLCHKTTPHPHHTPPTSPPVRCLVTAPAARLMAPPTTSPLVLLPGTAADPSEPQRDAVLATSEQMAVEGLFSAAAEADVEGDLVDSYFTALVEDAEGKEGEWAQAVLPVARGRGTGV